MFAQTAQFMIRLGAGFSCCRRKTWQLGEGRVATFFKPKFTILSTSKNPERPKSARTLEPIGTDTFRLRLMNSATEVSLLHEWGTAEGWIPGVHDARIFYQQDPTGFYLAVANGIPVGGVCSVKYGEDHVYGGQFIVRPAFREKRYGWEMAKSMVHMSAPRKLAIDAVENKQNQYERFFGFQQSWRTVRLQGIGTGCTIEGSPVDDTVILESGDKVDFESLLDFDRNVYGVPRSAFLKSWISQPGMISFAAVQKNKSTDQHPVEKKADKILGYGCIRLCYENYRDTKFSRRIGPFFAESPSIASCLFNALVSTVPAGTPFYIDVPDTNRGVIEIEKTEYRIQPLCSFARMYINGEWEIRRDMVYGLTIDIC